MLAFVSGHCDTVYQSLQLSLICSNKIKQIYLWVRGAITWHARLPASVHVTTIAGSAPFSKDLQISTTAAAVALDEEAQPWTPAKLIELGSATDGPSNPQGPSLLPLALSDLTAQEVRSINLFVCGHGLIVTDWTSPTWAGEVGGRDRIAAPDGMSLCCTWHPRRPSLQSKAAATSRCATLIVTSMMDPDG